MTLMEPVKLSDFITQSLVEIYQGIKGANKTIAASHGVALFNFGIGVGVSEGANHKLVHRLRFEVDVEHTSG